MAKPENVSWASPYIMVQHVGDSMVFYQKAFQFTQLAPAMVKDGIPVHAELAYRDQSIFIGYENSYDCCVKSPVSSGQECPINMYLYCDNVDEFCKAAELAGARVVEQPQDMFWGDRMCSLKCLNGYIWNFATHTGQ